MNAKVGDARLMDWDELKHVVFTVACLAAGVALVATGHEGGWLLIVLAVVL